MIGKRRFTSAGEISSISRPKERAVVIARSYSLRRSFDVVTRIPPVWRSPVESPVSRSRRG